MTHVAYSPDGRFARLRGPYIDETVDLAAVVRICLQHDGLTTDITAQLQLPCGTYVHLYFSPSIGEQPDATDIRYRNFDQAAYDGDYQAWLERARADVDRQYENLLRNWQNCHGGPFAQLGWVGPTR